VRLVGLARPLWRTTRRANGAGAGHKQALGSACLPQSRAWRRVAEKKAGRRRSPGPQPRRAEHEDARAGRRAGQALARGAEAGPAAQRADKVLADKACDTDSSPAGVAALGAEVVLAGKSTRLTKRPLDHTLYRDHKKVERFLSRHKQFRRLATRYDKAASSSLAMGQLVAAPSAANNRP